MPHLCAAHCRISSVVPEKPPVTRAASGLYLTAVRPYLSFWPWRKASSSAAEGRYALAAALAATVSRAGVTRAAASASLSGGLPGGRQAVIGPAGAVGEDAGAAVGAGRGSA